MLIILGISYRWVQNFEKDGIDSMQIAGKPQSSQRRHQDHKGY
jgi:hypothetical protein